MQKFSFSDNEATSLIIFMRLPSQHIAQSWFIEPFPSNTYLLQLLCGISLGKEAGRLV